MSNRADWKIGTVLRGCYSGTVFTLVKPGNAKGEWLAEKDNGSRVILSENACHNYELVSFGGDPVEPVDTSDYTTLTAGTPKEDPPKPDKFVYTQKHEIIPQQPGESDKAYLRRILGGR